MKTKQEYIQAILNLKSEIMKPMEREELVEKSNESKRIVWAGPRYPEYIREFRRLITTMEKEGHITSTSKELIYREGVGFKEFSLDELLYYASRIIQGEKFVEGNLGLMFEYGRGLEWVERLGETVNNN
jgi:hypothetical protein